MHPSLRVTAATLAVVLVAACFDFDATMAGGPPGESEVDAAANDGTTGNAPDGNVGNGDDGGAIDAALDATDATGLPDGGPFCASLTPPDGGLFFCDDFDERALPGSWNSFGETGGTLTETDAGALSKPNALDETTTPTDGGQVVDVALRTTLGVPSLPATLRFAFSVEPLQIDVTAAAAIVLGAVDFLDATGDRYSLGLAINVSSGAPALTLGEQTGYPDGGTVYVNHPLPPTEPLAMGAWSDVVIEIDWPAATTIDAMVFVNGTKKLDVPLTATVQATSLQIGVGTSYVSEPSPAWEIRYDNVVFTAQ